MKDVNDEDKKKLKLDETANSKRDLVTPDNDAKINESPEVKKKKSKLITIFYINNLKNNIR